MKYFDAAIVTMRNSSTRLPNKSMAQITPNTKAIDIIIERAKLTGLPVILATSLDKSDDNLTDIGEKHNILVFRGSLINKIKRWHECFEKFTIENALLIDGDDLCYDFNIGIRSLSELKTSMSDIIWCPKEIITGLFTLSVTKNAIKKLYNCVPDEKTNTDLFTHIFKKANLKITYVTLHDHEKNKEIRLTLDYKEDLEFFRKLYSQINYKDTGEKIIEFLMKNPHIIKINYQREKDFLNNKKIEVENNG